MAEAEILQTEAFVRWLRSLRDARARARIRIRIDYGPGYRVYLMSLGPHQQVLLAGGDKDSQARDIPGALRLAREIREQR